LIKTSDFIYFNGFIKNKKLISIFQKNDENKIIRRNCFET
jgi:aerotaxis receptor